MKKLVIMVTHGPQDPEKATIPFVMAVTAQASGVEVVLGFQADGVSLVKKGVVEGVHFAPFPPLKELLDTYRKAGGKLYVCGPCLQSRSINAADFVEGAMQVNAATFVAEIMEAANSLVY